MVLPIFINDLFKASIGYQHHLSQYLKTTGSLDFTLKELQVDDNDVVGSNSGDRNLSKSKKLKNAKSGI